jgi:hypothetical protein
VKTALPSPLSEKCGTCPFREGSPHAALAPQLAVSALTSASRICHQTGTNAIGGRTRKKPRLCRGARDIQLKHFHALGVIAEPTDAAWAAAWAAIKHA